MHITNPFLNHILNPQPQLYTPYISLGSLQVRVAQAINRTAEPLTLMVGTDWGNIRAILGLHGDNGKETGNYYDGLLKESCALCYMFNIAHTPNSCIIEIIIIIIIKGH